MLKNLSHSFKLIFLTPVSTLPQKLIIIFVAVLFAFMHDNLPLDWDLNTTGFWANFPNTYDNENFVYPPWGMILMLPYRWMHPEGARFLSVLVIGALVMQKKWNLSTFFAIALSPYFVGTLGKSAFDILVLVFPIYLWEQSSGKKWQTPARGLAISLTLLKPQAAIFIWIYYFYKERRNWRSLIWPLAIVSLIVIPISLIGSPPLFLQWVDNLRHPSQDNLFYWSINNFSLTSKFTLFGAAAILLTTAFLLFFLVKKKVITWSENMTQAAILYASMGISPYTSQQSISSSLAFVPSWFLVGLQVVHYYCFLNIPGYRQYLPIAVLLLVSAGIIFFKNRNGEINHS